MVIDLFAERAVPLIYDDEASKLLKEIFAEYAAVKSVFNFVTESDAIESAIYKMKSLEASYIALLKQAKLKGYYNQSSFTEKKL